MTAEEPPEHRACRQRTSAENTAVVIANMRVRARLAGHVCVVCGLLLSRHEYPHELRGGAAR